MKLPFKNSLRSPFLGALIVLGAAPANAAETAWQTEDMARARIVSSQQGTAGQQEILLGVQIQLKEGWKTYWRSPGDSGLPPVFNWQNGNNIKSTQVEWPRPAAFDSFGIQSWGYQSEVIFPIRVTLNEPDQPINATLNFSYGVCELVCVPLNHEFTISIPSGEAGSSAHAALIQEYRDTVPPSLKGQSDIQAISASLATPGQLEITVSAAVAFQSPILIVEGEDGDFFDVAAPVIEVTGKKSIFRVTADVADKATPLKGREIVVTVLDKGLSLEEHIQIK